MTRSPTSIIASTTLELMAVETRRIQVSTAIGAVVATEQARADSVLACAAALDDLSADTPRFIRSLAERSALAAISGILRVPAPRPW